METIPVSIEFAIPIFCIATMFAIGLNTTFGEALAPLRNLLAVVIVVLVNNVIVPLLGVVALRLAIVPDDAAIVFLLLLLASGNALGPTLAKLSGADIKFAKGMIVILLVATTLLLPLELELFKGLVDSASLEDLPEFVEYLLVLLGLQLVPLALGMIIKEGYEPVAKLIRPWILQLSNLAFLFIVSMFLLKYLYELTSRDGAASVLAILGPPSIIFLIVAAILMIVGYYGGIAVRNVAGATGTDIPRSLATTTTARNISFVLILLWWPIDEATVSGLELVIIFYLLSLIVAGHQAVQWAKKDEEKAAEGDASGEANENIEGLDAAAPG